jgi:hypothetical protein
MGELEHELIDDAVVADRAGDGADLRVRRHLWDEVFAVKMLQLFLPDPTGHDRHMVDVGPFDHCVDGSPGALDLKLAGQMFFPKFHQGLLFARQRWLGRFVALGSAGGLSSCQSEIGPYGRSGDCPGRLEHVPTAHALLSHRSPPSIIFELQCPTIEAEPTWLVLCHNFDFGLGGTP